MYANQISDVYQSINDVNFPRIQEEKENLTKKLYEEIWPNNLRYFERRLIDNKTGFIVGSGISWADIFLSATLDLADDRRASLLRNFPNVRALDEMVRRIPGISNWIATRPKTEL
jgi:glutathione S-transferase